MDFDDDPEHGPRDRPYFLCGLVFFAALAIAWFLHLERVGANVP
jgi:hypothetical protein